MGGFEYCGDAELRTTTEREEKCSGSFAMAQISAQLAAYTALVESARANNRQGFVIGSAYLREASSLMQTSLLPGAEKVYTANLATVEEASAPSVPCR